MNLYLRVWGEGIDRSSPVRNCRSLKFARKESKVQGRRYEAGERSLEQGCARIRTGASGQTHEENPDSAIMGKSFQSQPPRETNAQGKHPEEIGEILNSRWRRRNYAGTHFPPACSQQISLLVKKDTTGLSQNSLAVQGIRLTKRRATQNGCKLQLTDFILISFHTVQTSFSLCGSRKV